MASWFRQRSAPAPGSLGRTGAALDAAADPATAAAFSRPSALERRGVSVETVAIDSGSAQAMTALLAERENSGAAPILEVTPASPKASC